MAGFYRLWKWISRSSREEEEPLLGGSRSEYIARREALEDYEHLPHLHANTNITSTREWLHVDQNGNITFLTVDKHVIVTELGIPYRDLRFIDPLVATQYPCAIFIRDKALVANIESCRMIITDDQVFVLTVPQEGKPFSYTATPTADNHFVQELVARVKPGTNASTPRMKSRSKTGIDRHLPYELRALEAALSVAVRCMESEVVTIEQMTLPALKRLMNKVTSSELDSVRHSKTAVNKLLTRVKVFKKELEDILDDDEDMQNMYLGRRAQARLAAENESCESSGEDSEVSERSPSPPRRRRQHRKARAGRDPHLDEPQQALRPVESATGMAHQVMQPAISAPAPSAIPHPHEIKGRPVEQGPMQSAPSAPPTEFPASRQKAKTYVKGTKSWRRQVQKIAAMLAFQHPHGYEDPNDISGVESMLENYFMMVDFLLSRLQSLEENIDGCEDQLDIELDHRRNELVALDLVIGAVMAMFAFVSMIGGVFGMNLKNGWEESTVAFYSTTGVTLTMAGALMVAIVIYARRKRLLFIPDSMSRESRRS